MTGLGRSPIFGFSVLFVSVVTTPWVNPTWCRRGLEIRLVMSHSLHCRKSLEAVCYSLSVVSFWPLWRTSRSQRAAIRSSMLRNFSSAMPTIRRPRTSYRLQLSSRRFNGCAPHASWGYWPNFALWPHPQNLPRKVTWCTFAWNLHYLCTCT